jgi:hypothetical protein
VKTKKQKIKQQIIATLVIVFMFVMITGSFNVADLLAATTSTTNLIQNIVAGTLGIQAPYNIVFNQVNVSQAANSLANMDTVNMWDYRGSGAGWDVTGYSNNLAIATAGINNIANTSIFWTPGTLVNLQGTKVNMSTGAAGASMGVGNTTRLVNANAGFGMGNYQVKNTVMNVVYNGRPDQLQGSYAAVLTMNIW